MIITKKHTIEEVNAPFSDLLKQKLAEKKITMKGLGKIVGVHRTTISDYVSGKYLPKEETFHRIHQVIPDKDLYDSYFEAVSKTEPRKNKNIIPEATAYNFYKAEEEKVTKADEVANIKLPEVKTSNISTLDKEYIACALKFVIEYYEKVGLDTLAVQDYVNYKELYEEFSKE